MAKRHPIPDGIRPSATVELIGLIKTRTRSEFVPLTKQYVCRMEVEVGDMDIVVMVQGDLANSACYSATTPVRVKGALQLIQWDTGDGKLHTQTGVLAEELDAIDHN